MRFDIQLNYHGDIIFDGSSSDQKFAIVSVTDSINAPIEYTGDYKLLTMHDLDPGQYTVTIQAAEEVSGNWRVSILCVSDSPTSAPTLNPTPSPTQIPSRSPSNDPTSDPTAFPTINPTFDPSAHPTTEPTDNPSKNPTNEPTFEPT